MEDKLRADVLDKSLTMESLLSQFIGVLLRIPIKDSRTIGSKSSSLSFKTKVDFLFDLGKLSTDDCKQLTLFMEVRNQLIHNIEIDTMYKALEATKNTAKIMKFQEADTIDREMSEYDYRIAFHNFYGTLLQRVGEVLETINAELAAAEEQAQKAADSELFDKHLELLSEAIDEASDHFDQLFERPEGEGGALRRSIQARFYVKLKAQYPNRKISAPGEFPDGESLPASVTS